MDFLTSLRIRPLTAGVIFAWLAACSPSGSNQNSAAVAPQSTIGSLDATAFVKLAEGELIPQLKAYTPESVRNVSGCADALKEFEFLNLHASHAAELTMTLAQTKVRTKFLDLLRSKQVKLFPLMRATYAREFNAKISIPATITAVGSKDKILQLTTPIFLSEDTAQQADEVFLSLATELRFKQIKMWHTLHTKYWTFKVFGQDDSKVGS